MIDSTAGETAGFHGRSRGGAPWRSAIMPRTVSGRSPSRTGNGGRPVSIS